MTELQGWILIVVALLVWWRLGRIMAGLGVMQRTALSASDLNLEHLDAMASSLGRDLDGVKQSVDTLKPRERRDY